METEKTQLLAVREGPQVCNGLRVVYNWPLLKQLLVPVIIQSTGCVDEGRFVVEDGSIVGVGTQLDSVFEDVVTGDPASVEGQPPASIVA